MSSTCVPLSNFCLHILNFAVLEYFNFAFSFPIKMIQPSNTYIYVQCMHKNFLCIVIYVYVCVCVCVACTYVFVCVRG